MRVAMLIGSVTRRAGGLYESVRNLAKAMASAGDQMLVVAPADHYLAEDLPAWSPVEVRTVPAWGPWQFGFSPEYRRHLEDFKPDIIGVHGIWMYHGVAARAFAFETKCPVVVHPHGMLDRWALDNSRWKKRLAAALYEDRNLRNAACLRVLCSAEAEAVRAYGLSNLVAAVPNGVVLPDPLPAPGAGPAFAAAIEPGRKVMLFLGRLHPKKGLADLIAAWPMAMAESRALREEWALAIVGWGEAAYRASLAGAIAAAGLQRTIHLCAPCFGAERDACYRAAAAFVLPSFSEGLPMAVLEAWAHGRPVLMSSACNLPEGFAAGAASCVANDPVLLAGSLVRMAEMPDELRRAMGVRGGELVANSFSWPSLAARLRECHAWLLDPALPRPSCIY